MSNKIFPLIPILAVQLTIMGCSVQNDNDSILMDDDKTEREINERQSRNSNVSSIELPEQEFSERYEYKNENLKDPFHKDKGLSNHSGIVPDFDREKEVLENYSLSNITFKGTVSLKDDDKEVMALTSDGKIHRIGVDNYIGENYGKINSISDEKVEIRELYRVDSGVWEARITTKSTQ